MSASVKVTRNFAPLGDLPLTTVADMREVGLLARERIVRRTLRGIDAHGAPFQPYSAAYAAIKGSTHVDLQVSGNMLNHLTITHVDENSVTLGWLQ
jgi:CTP:molybdopterin cytidylyltransferase MocA